MDSEDFDKCRMRTEGTHPQEKLMYLTHRLTEETTAHGIPHISRANGFWRSSIWILISLAMVATWIYHSQYTISQYMKMEVNVKLKLQTAQNLPFPAMTVCNKNAFKKTITEEWVGHMMNRMFTPEGRNAQYPKWLQNFVAHVSKMNATSGLNVQSANPSQLGEDLVQMQMDSMIKFAAEYNFSVDSFTHSYQDLVMSCHYERIPCEKRGIKIRKIFNWLHGHCYVFNAEREVLLSTQTGPRYGLRLTLNIEQDEYSEVVDQAGVRVVVHEPDEMPFPEDDGYNIPPGLSASIGARLVKTRRLGGSYSQCIESKDQAAVHDIFREHTGWTKYSLKTCLLTCYQRELESRCGCSDVRYPQYNRNFAKFISCTENKTMTFGDEFTAVDPNDCLRLVQEMYRNQSLNCAKECKVPCSDIGFVSSVSYSVWPAMNAEYTVATNVMKIPSGARVLNQSAHNIYKHFLEVTLYYEDFSYHDISERPAIMLTECLSDLGGNMGMYVGASLFTFFELFQYFFDVLLWSCAWCCRILIRGRSGSQGALKRVFATTKVQRIQVKPQDY